MWLMMMKFGCWMKTVNYNHDKHYEIISTWWTAWKWDIIPTVALPENGIVIYSDCGIPLCAGFIYKTDSCIAWIENIISNKSAPKDKRGGAVDFLIKALCERAKELGFTVAMTSICHTGLMDKMISNNFQKTDLNMTNMLRVL